MHAKDQTSDLPPGDALPVPAGGSILRDAHFYAVRVFFEDTDLSGVAYHANYLRWFERARSDLLRMLDIDQRAAHEAGEGAYAVSDLAIRYASPARLDDDVLIQTRAVQIGRASCRLNQRAWLGGDQRETLLAEMDVRVGFVAPNGRPRRQPDEWLQAFENFIARSAKPGISADGGVLPRTSPDLKA
ncbi:YbgC/FadM family acyl-CoA thioesterase [Croceicoccus marinus]|jgi:acyl-CoA thioester hydrolase|uniref:YbgC/FadM family acyl-CoA thioesterase n=1 Tax=Croceicoccus marinus TaxID=450378 RepID=A0A7G6VWZ2_9SPHN|nr:YbgC/FadM family acyl-CoA thioesterase [Croceicoccus marinus]QNE06257.1 YbgC/FadM family acyl-CoA thioesterase [Croceicoccus marinus]